MTQTQELTPDQQAVYQGIQAVVTAALALHAAFPEEPWLTKLDATIVNLSKLSRFVEPAPVTTVTEATLPTPG